MSVGVINLVRLIFLPALAIAFFALFVLILKNKRFSKLGCVLLKIFTLCIIAVVVFIVILLPAFNFKIDNDFKNIINNVSIQDLNIDMFEFSPYEAYDINERWVVCKESGDTSYNTTVWFVIQPKDTYRKTIKTGEGSLYGLVEKVCLTEFENKYGSIKIYPACIEKYHETFLSMDFYGTIVIPISQDFDLVIEYICDSNINECKDYISNELKALMF
ncbi:MAG: hypothetical protein IKV21_03040 [Clostridia bacterium]|nr:hypothetical protein [Clostridia bacterium]